MTVLDRRALLVAGGAALTAPAWGAEPSVPPPFPGGDVALLKRAYDAMHPGLLRYQAQAQSDAAFARLERRLGDAKDLRVRYLALSQTLAAVRCGHTYANFFNQSKAVQAALFENRDRLPFQFRWLGPRMVVTADPTDLGIAPGTEVLAIEGRPAADILAGLMTVARADGHNDGKRRMLMSVQATERYESFDAYYPLLFEGRDRYRLSLRAPDGRTSERTVEAMGFKDRLAQQKAEVAEPDAPQWRYDRRGGVAVLDMPTWALYDSNWDWRAWLDARFEEMARDRVTGLVIDLPQNEGGNDCGDAMIARLIDAPIQRDATHRLVRYRKAPPELHPYLDTWDHSFETLGVDAKPFDARFLLLDDKEDDGRPAGRIQPKGPRFRGRVAVLVGSRNSSATHQFASVVQRERLGVLVGEETGGNQRGINGGCFFFLRLPESGLEADLPLIGQFPLTPKPDRGVAPDLAAPETVASLAARRDVALDRALEAVSG